MCKILIRCLVLAIAASFLISCSWLQPDSPATNEKAEFNPRAVRAHMQLSRLQNSDVLLRLDNALLSSEISRQLQQYIDESKQFEIQKVDLEFAAQSIQMTTHLNFVDAAGTSLQAVATGEIELEVSGEGIEWVPVYNHWEAASNEQIFVANSESTAETLPHQKRLNTLNAVLTSALGESNFNYIDLQSVPLGEVEVGTRLVTFDNATSIESASLNGMFFVTGSAVLIEQAKTSILLDLRFVPNLAVCPADIHVSRAVFSRTIASREPVDITRNFDNVDDMRTFYSEISGATRAMTIIHYWFADGQPVAVEELPVGPSERWRTWSSRGPTPIAASHWQVLVVEKESGCILHSQSIRTTDPDGAEVLFKAHLQIDDFSAYRNAFQLKTKAFPAAGGQPGEISIDVRREYLQQVIQSAVSDLQIETRFDQTELLSQQFDSELLPFETRDIICEDQQCANPLVCTSNIAHCKRQRDTRECNSCLFRNPLNNRCLQSADDPICVAAKNRQNVIFEQDHEACIAAAENSQHECQQLSNQITQSCEIETTVEKSVCEASKSEIMSLKPGSALAGITAKSSVKGQLSALFSNFKIADNLTRLQQNVTVKSNLAIQGQLEFKPENTDGLLSSCINAWSGPFTNRAISSTPLNSMLTSLHASEDSFTATWSGLVLPLKMTASPLESALVRNPQLLAACSIGLSVAKVEQATVGPDTDFFTGSLNLIFQPLPTRIKLNTAHVEIAAQVLEGAASISEGFISYQLK